jgi:hypothetical protein
MVNNFYESEDFWKNYMANWFGCELIEKWQKNATTVDSFIKDLTEGSLR